MENSFSIFQIVLGAGPVVQLVLLILVLMSILCWTIIIFKARIFSRARKTNQEFDTFFAELNDLSQVESRARRMLDCPMAQVFLTAYLDYLALQKDVKFENTKLNRKAWIEIISRSISKGIKQEIQDLETTLPLLATTGNSAPFIGLFGTVWGIMKSFHNIGLQGSASLATVAPGISEALIATAVGLAAAIPAVIAYNIFTSSTLDMEKDLETFGTDLINVIERELLKRESAATIRYNDVPRIRT